MKKSIIFLAAIAAFFSCAKDNSVHNTTAEKTFSVTLTASAPTSEDAPSLASADTKTTLVDGPVVNGKPSKFVHWSQGDAIRVLFFPGRHSNEITGPSGVFSSHFDGESSASANFRIENWSFGMDQSYVNSRLYSKGIAVYPSSANATSTKASGSYTNNVSDVSFTLPSEQKAIENNIDSNLNFSYADVDLASFTNTINNPSYQTKLKFNNVCALIQLTMPAQMPKVTEISISSNDKVALTGHGSMNYTTGLNQEVNGTVTITDRGNVVLKNANGFKAGATYYAVVWPGEHGSGLTIEFKAEDGTVATKTTPTVTLTASKIKPYTFNKGLVFEAPSMDYDYYYSDGSIGTDPTPSGKSVVGVVFYKGNPRDLDPNIPELNTHGLAISVKKAQQQWHTSNLPNEDYSKYGLGNTNGEVWGYTAKLLWRNNVGVNLNLYYRSGTFTTLPMIGEYISLTDWYYPTNCELKLISDNYSHVTEKLAACGGDKLPTSSLNGFWTPLASSTDKAYVAYYQSYSNSFSLAKQTLTYPYYIQPIFAF